MHDILHDAAIAVGTGAAKAPPLMNETPGAGGAPGSQESKADTPNSTDITAQRKLEFTLPLKAAREGFELMKLTDGTWEARRWGLVKPLATSADVEAWLQRAAGGAP